jgi:hypothetical protein
MADRHSDRLGVPPPAQDDEQPQVLSVATPQGGRRAFFRALSTTAAAAAAACKGSDSPTGPSASAQPAPIVHTLPVQRLASTSADLVASVDARGQDSTLSFFKCARNREFTEGAVNTGGDRLLTSTFNATWIRALSGLSPGTTYFYQAIAQNTGSAAQGEILSFTTPNASGGATVMCTCNTVCTCNANGCACNAQGGSTCTCNPQGGGGGGGGHYWYPN